MLEATEAPETATIQQLKLRLLVRKAVQTFDHQDPNHHLGRIGRTPTFGLLWTGSDLLYRLR